MLVYALTTTPRCSTLNRSLSHTVHWLIGWSYTNLLYPQQSYYPGEEEYHPTERDYQDGDLPEDDYDRGGGYPDQPPPNDRRHFRRDSYSDDSERSREHYESYDDYNSQDEYERYDDYDQRESSLDRVDSLGTGNSLDRGTSLETGNSLDRGTSLEGADSFDLPPDVTSDGELPLMSAEKGANNNQYVFAMTKAPLQEQDSLSGPGTPQSRGSQT